MKLPRTVCLLSLLSGPGVAQAQGTGPLNEKRGSDMSPGTVVTREEEGQNPAAAISAPSLQPGQSPPPPPSEGQAQASPHPAAVRRGAAAGGSWVYTLEYGRIWVPYANEHTYGGMAAAASPYWYSYRPLYERLWLAEPWLWSLDVQPDFGPLGPSGLEWYRGPYLAADGGSGYPGARQSGQTGWGHRSTDGLGGDYQTSGGSRGSSNRSRAVGAQRGGINSGAQGNSGSRSGLGGRGGGRRR
jgi:hypothetical protein